VREKDRILNMNIEYTPIHFTRESHIIDYLEKTLFYIKSVDSKPTDWKWVILSLHSALYNTAICASRGNNNDWITVESKDRKTWTPRRDLISIWKALKDCQDINIMKIYIHSKELRLDDSEKENIRKLTETFRNKFEHFQPWSWMIEIHWFPHICIDVLNVIYFLIFESQNCINFDESQKNEIRRIINESKDILSNSNLYKEAKYLLEQENAK
jgi:hypothetical protein